MHLKDEIYRSFIKIKINLQLNLKVNYHEKALRKKKNISSNENFKLQKLGSNFYKKQKITLKLSKS